MFKTRHLAGIFPIIIGLLVMGCSSSADICPPPAQPDLPIDPPPEYGEVIQTYLSEGGGIEYLKDRLLQWSLPNYQRAVAVETADLTGDDVDEVIVLAQYANPGADGYSPYGQLYIYACQDQAYHLEYQSEKNSYDNRSSGIFAIEDINNTGLRDVVHTWGFCGVSLCSTDIQVIEWSDDSNSFAELLPGGAGMWQAEVTLIDLDQDGQKEIWIETNGKVSSLSIGPRVAEINIYAWDGEFYQFVEARYPDD